MGQNSITMFTNDSTSAGGPVAYVQDAFPDVTDTPNTNSGFSSTLSNNPLNKLFGNDDFPRFGPKTLWIKDLVLLQDRALWVNGEPTYECIWNEPFPSASGYVYGNIQLIRTNDQTYVQVKNPNDGFGVTGVFARCMFLMNPSTAAIGAATAKVFVDGLANATVPDWGALTTANLKLNTMWAASVSAGANETYNIHDFRLVANQGGGVFQIFGVVVYSENSSLNIDQFPGTTYNNKNQSRTTVGVTLPLPVFGTSLGGRSTIWKTAAAGYSMSVIPVPTVQSIATGTNGTNILNVTAGHGGSYSVGNGVITASSAGASSYVGVIQSISTDALTVFPTLPFGISNSIYRYFQAGQSLALNASLNALAYTFGSTEYIKSGFTTAYLDPLQNFAAWGQGIGLSLLDGSNPCVTYLSSPTGFFQCEGNFSAAEIEWFGQSFAVLSGTMCVNGLPVYNHSNIGFTGFLKKTVFTDAGPGWNTFSFFAGSSHINTGISRVNLYQRSRDISASFGVLASFDTLQSFNARATSATTIPPGCYKRVYADQLPIGPSFLRAVGATHAGGIAYASSQAGSSFSFQFYGDKFSVIGGSYGAIAGGSLSILIDGLTTFGFTNLNQVLSGGSLAFHRLQINILGGTNYISAIDYYRTQGEMVNLQTFSQTGQTPLNTQTKDQNPYSFFKSRRDLPLNMNNSFSLIINPFFTAYRVGDYLNGAFAFLGASLNPGATLAFVLPPGMTIDNRNRPQTSYPVGQYTYGAASGNIVIFRPLFIDGTTTDRILFGYNTDANAQMNGARVGTDIISPGQYPSGTFSVPILNWGGWFT